MVSRSFTYEPEDFCVALPVREDGHPPKNAFHRVENLQAETRRT
jgi:hypothetical protein